MSVLPATPQRDTTSVNWTAAREAMIPLWPLGLGLLLLLLGNRLISLPGKAHDWALYVMLGTLFPVLLIAGAQPAKTGRISSAKNLGCILLGAVGVVLLTILIGKSGHFGVFVFAIAQWVLMTFTRRRGKDITEELILPEMLVGLLVTLAAWAAAAPLVWWTPLPSLLRELPAAQIVFGIVFLASCLVLRQAPPWRASWDQARVVRLAEGSFIALALGVFAMASLRTDQLFGQAAFHHWGVFVGPALLVRQGGWLLWDVPSQYGFLSILSVAALPVRSAWESLYLINAGLLFLSAGCVFFMLRACLPHGAVTLLLAFVVTLAAVFLVPGFALLGWGPQVFPSVGAFRFIWCYLLLAVLVAQERAGAQRPLLLRLGWAAWLLGTLWSSESAAYCAVIWLPASLLIAWQRAQILSDNRARRAFFGRCLCVPLGLLLSAAAVIEMIYRFFLGHGPDWAAFTDYTRAFGQGFGALPLDTHGPVWSLLLVFGAAATAFAAMRRRDPAHPGLAVALGAGGIIWATGSYFMGRSHPNNADNLAPLLCVALAALLLIAKRHDEQTWGRLLRRAGVPLFAILGAAGFGGGLPTSVWSAQGHAEIWHVERQLPVGSGSLEALLAQAQVQPGQPIDCFDLNLLPASRTGGAQKAALSWLPLCPFAVVRPLPLRRAAVYLHRFASLHQRSGWLLEPKRVSESWDDWGADAASDRPWLHMQLRRDFVPLRSFQNADYSLTWYQYLPQGGSAR